MTSAGALNVPVDLPAGRVETVAWHERAEAGWATMAIAHGAGAGSSHPFLAGFAAGMRGEGVSTLRFDFPYLTAGRRMPGPPAHAVATWRAVAALAADLDRSPLWVAGKSYGGRMASMAAAERAISPAGLVYLGYPLHPPGRPDKPRSAHLPRVAQPQLFVEGTRDPFIDPHAQLVDALAACADARIAWVEGAGHSFEVAGRRRDAATTGAELAPIVAAWMRERS
jgi:predicted alpha/beta-hydrolase family hydrolase